MVDNKTKINEIFKEHGLKMTPQRLSVYQALAGNRSHPNVNQVYDLVKKQLPSISFDTVFRTISHFAEIGLIDKVSSTGGSKRYDPNTDDHHHFECKVCGDIIDLFDIDIDLSGIASQIGDDLMINKTKLVMTGICSNCR